MGYHEKRHKNNIITTTTTATTASEENIKQLMPLLSRDDGVFLAEFAKRVVANYATNTFSLADQHAVSEILRYMILGRTIRCRVFAPISTAQMLCNKHEGDGSEFLCVMVCDMTAKPLTKRVLAQNKTSSTVIGDLRLMGYDRLMCHADVYRLLLAIGGAFHQPNVRFRVFKQQVVCGKPPQTSLFDMTYLVDPDSFFLVVFGQKVNS